ncbi:hypothetical protein AGMMS50230_18740 [Spirochaetia bacterium]|nr:hypothetical protein AGMMS50230_18740 [Spirochaetia bacterium]
MNRSIGGFILYIATALYLLAAGILGLFGGRGGEFYGMVSGILGGGGLSTVIAIIFSLAAALAGVLLILQLFGMEFSIIETILIAFIVLWVLFILVSDIILPLRSHPGLLVWLRTLASHLVVLGAIITGTKTFGGN